MPGIGWTDLDYFQSASGLPSLHLASERKAGHRQKRRSKHQPKHKKPKQKQKQKRKPTWKKISKDIGKDRH